MDRDARTMELAEDVVTQLLAYVDTYQEPNTTNPAEAELDRKRLAYALINLIDERINRTLERRPGLYT